MPSIANSHKNRVTKYSYHYCISRNCGHSTIQKVLSIIRQGVIIFSLSVLCREPGNEAGSAVGNQSSLCLTEEGIKKNIRSACHSQKLARLLRQNNVVHAHTHIFSASGIKLATNNLAFLILGCQYTGMNVP